MAENIDAEVIVRLARIEVLLATHLETVKDHEGRIRSLEQVRWKLYGFAAALGGGSGLVVTKLLGG